MAERFSKKVLAKYINGGIERLYLEYGFDPKTGYAQVEKADANTNRAYGRLMQLESLRDMFDLEATQ